MYFKYGEKEIKYLINQDKKLGEYILKRGIVKRELDTNLYESLVSSIIGQQISTKAATTVRNNLLDVVGVVNPNNLHKLSVDELKALGMGIRKANFLFSLTEHFINHPFFEEELIKLNTNDKIVELTKLRGIGPWTAEMILIHFFNERDILSFRDLGIVRGIKRLYNLEEISKEEEKRLKELFSPYGTVAAIYFWELSK